ncbi:MAG TPA: class I SAM-dependent methyltransferase, partial [Chloroflexota bacterium]|nr:class I SAM-dependent methyltransferase [Chloroflexota bacterium]
MSDNGNSDYNAIYRNAPIQQIDSFYLWALRWADVRKDQRLLDVSCGVARLVEFAWHRGVRSVGIDLATQAIAVARQAGVCGELLVGNAESLPFADASFDRVVNLGSLEHYERPQCAIAEMARVLRPDGRAVILLPNAFGYQHVLYVWRHGTVYDDGQPLQR